MKKGFTLIEVVVYIGLFSLLIGTVFIAAYQLIDGSGKTSSKITVQNEGNFVIEKINWALTGLDPTKIPDIAPATSVCPASQMLTVTKTDTSINTVVIKLDTVNGKNYIEIQKNGGTFYPLTTDNVSVSCLQFSITNNTVTATATINDIPFTISKYIRR